MREEFVGQNGGVGFDLYEVNREGRDLGQQSPAEGVG